MGARLRGRTATQRSKKGSEKALGRVLGKGFWEGFWEGGLFLWVLQYKRVLRRVLRRGSEKAVSRRCLECPLEEYAPLGVRPLLRGPASIVFISRDTCSDSIAKLFRAFFRKILAPIKTKSALPPPPKTPPQKNAEFYGHGFSCRKNAFFQVSIKLAQPFPAPELRTRILRTRGFFWFFLGYRTIIARYFAKWGIAQMRLCELKYQGGCIAPFWGSADRAWKVSRDMGYRSDSIAISRDMGPLWGVQKLTQSGLNGISERDYWKTNLPFLGAY